MLPVKAFNFHTKSQNTNIVRNCHYSVPSKRCHYGGEFELKVFIQPAEHGPGMSEKAGYKNLYTQGVRLNRQM